MTERKGEILVGLSLALRGSSLLFSKIALETMGPFQVMGSRSLTAFILVALLFHKKLRTVTSRELYHCFLLGIVYILSMVFELNGLKTTPSTIAGFLEGSIVIVVPLLTCIIYRKLPNKATVISSLIALVGVAFLTLKGDRLGFTTGELLVLGSTFWFSLTVIITDNAAKTDDPMNIAIFQLLFIAIFAYAGAFFFEGIRLPSTGSEWGAILGLAVICTGVGFTLQPLGQKYTTPERAGLLIVFNPLTATALGVLFLHEKITWAIVAGSALIIFAILTPAWIKWFAPRNRED